jgi:2-methylcitrate dehydratase PrpD
LPWSRTALETILRIEGTGDKTIIGWGRTASGPVAALLNGTFIQGFELDDFHPGGPLHSASVVIPSLLPCAQELGHVDGGRFLLGAIAGFEVGPRVGMALHGAQTLSRGWHSGSVFGTHASAVAAGKLLGLDAARFEDAVGLAGTQPCGLMAAQFEAMCKRMHHGFAARTGLYSALLAAGGYTGIKRVFEREYGGFPAVFGEGHDPDASRITRGLGEQWETHRIAIKPYAAMSALHAPLDAIFDIMANHPFTGEQVDHIDIYMSHSAFHHGWRGLVRPLTPTAVQMSVGYAVAVAILDRAAMISQFTPQRIDDDDVWALIPRITAHHDPEFDKAGLQSCGGAVGW